VPEIVDKVAQPVKKLSVGAILVILGVLFLVFLAGAAFGAERSGLSDGTGSAKSGLDYQSVDKLYRLLEKNFDGELDIEELNLGLKTGLVSATGDPFTEYLTQEQTQELQEDLDGTFSGIGAELSKDDNFVIIVAPLSGFPAEEAGLKSRDVIVEIDGETAFDISVTEAVQRIRGPAGTDVQLKVIRDESEELDFEITRSVITIPSVEYEVLDNNIGYIRLTRFAEDTSRLVNDAARSFVAGNVEGVILDMRSNPGGLLESSVDVASVWLPGGETVLKEKRGGVETRTFTAKGRSILESVPTVVLINEGSASASEIVAGALRDSGAARLIGEQTFGKGSVQTLEGLPDGSTLKVTVARWFTPGGLNIDEEGITPDEVVERPDEEDEGVDSQRDRAVEYLLSRQAP
jgi:carboxyl-terminal processing protease